MGAGTNHWTASVGVVTRLVLATLSYYTEINIFFIFDRYEDETDMINTIAIPESQSGDNVAQASFILSQSVLLYCPLWLIFRLTRQIHSVPISLLPRLLHFFRGAVQSQGCLHILPG